MCSDWITTTPLILIFAKFIIFVFEWHSDHLESAALNYVLLKIYLHFMIRWHSLSKFATNFYLNLFKPVIFVGKNFLQQETLELICD